jgi:hypothetical protein
MTKRLRRFGGGALSYLLGFVLRESLLALGARNRENQSDPEKRHRGVQAEGIRGGALYAFPRVSQAKQVML